MVSITGRSVLAIKGQKFFSVFSVGAFAAFCSFPMLMKKDLSSSRGRRRRGGRADKSTSCLGRISNTVFAIAPNPVDVFLSARQK